MALRYTALFVVSMLWAIGNTAQSPSAAGSFAYTFSVYALKPISKEGLFFRDATGQYIELALETKRRSRAYEATLLHQSPELSFHRKEIAEDGHDFMRLVARRRIQQPEAAHSLLIFSSHPKSNQGELEDVAEFQIIEMDDSRSTFPRGSIRLLNATGVHVVGDINGERFELMQHESSQAVTELDTSKAQVSVAARGKERYRLLYKNLIPVSDKTRSLLIIRPPTREGSFKIGGRLLVDH